MRILDVIENAVWMTGDEPPEMVKKYKQDVMDLMDETCRLYGFVHDPVAFTEKLPGDDRVPQVPDHIQGSKVRLLVGEALITKELPRKQASFIAGLDKKDLDKLRKITRRTYAKFYRTLIGNETCDEIIEALGPAAAVATLKTYG